jgi:hypothetical protein
MVPETGVAEAPAIELALSRQEAALLLDGVRVLQNCRKFAFRDERPDDAGEALAALEDLAGRLRSTFGLK